MQIECTGGGGGSVYAFITVACASSSSLLGDANALLEFKAGIWWDENNMLSNWSSHNVHGLCQDWAGVKCSSSSSSSPSSSQSSSSSSRSRTRRVVSLELDDHGLLGVFSLSICNLTFLSHLNLSFYELYGPIPQNIGLQSRLQHLILVAYSIQSPSLQGPFPESLRNCSSLQTLHVQPGWDVHEPSIIPAWLGNLKHLTVLHLHMPSFKGSIPGELQNLTLLQDLSLSLYGDGWSSPVPLWLGHLFHLQRLQLYGLRGGIPIELRNLSHLQSLALGLDGGGRGPIPSWLQKLTRLQCLALWGDYFVGPIPKELGTLGNLIHLNLSGADRLSGSIPEEFGNLSQLQSLSFTFNNGSGLIPSSLGKLSHLQSLWFSTGTLRGSMLMSWAI